ncbi:MAG: 5-formyltetrahydrofolate cyclo-ligase [Zoogloea sp.]|nr:5-formyltetrahydrofolate cyclo-ligase [Zoogloea sp.]
MRNQYSTYGSSTCPAGWANWARRTRSPARIASRAARIRASPGSARTAAIQPKTTTAAHKQRFIPYHPARNRLEHSTVNSPNSPKETDFSQLRKALRESRIAARLALSMHDRAERTAVIANHLDLLAERLEPVRLAFCWPHRGEADITGWVADWLEGAPGREAALPVVDAPGQPMRFVAWTPETVLVPDRHGIPVPQAGHTIVPQVILVPLNAFDAHGYRLGYGGGYFDRTLAVLEPAPVTIGIAFELALADTIHPQPHDLPMNWIVTETGIRRIATPHLSTAAGQA